MTILLMPRISLLGLSMTISLFLTVINLIVPAGEAAAQGKNSEKYFVKFRNGNYAPPPEYHNSKRLLTKNTQTKAPAIKKNYLIQFYDLPDNNERLQIQAMGIELLQYIPNNAYWATVPDNLDSSTLKKLNIRSVSDIRHQDKTSPALDSLLKEKSYVDVNISVFKNLPVSEIIAALTSKGIAIQGQTESPVILKSRISKEQLSLLLSVEGVSYIAPLPPAPQPLNFKEANSSRVNILRSQAGNNRDLKGEGIKIAIGDQFSGNIHKDIQNRVINYSNSTGSQHGDHTSGILAGNGNINSLNAGMAPKATLVFTDLSSDITSASTFYQRDKVRITSNSYSALKGGSYDYNSITIDYQCSGDFPDLLHVFGAGNDGSNYNTISSSWAASKNALVVGSISASGVTSLFSSRGPLADGRLKPDVVSEGEFVTSTLPVNDYGELSGTSMACPGVAGAAALLYERYKQLNSNATPSSGLIKAILSNTADDVETTGPDYKSGFGRVNLRRAVAVIEEKRYFIANINAGQINTHNLSIPPGTMQLKVLLYWHDKEAFEGASSQLVNDLDLKLEQGGDTFLPWILNPAQADLPATKGEDHLNNVEQISIDNPNGTYSIKVDGSFISGSNQVYELVYEFIRPEIIVTFPYANEKLAPGDVIDVLWDATVPGPFALSYTTDLGNTWKTIASDIQSNAYFNWTVPDTTTGKLMLKVENGNFTGISTGASSIMSIPEQLSVELDSSGQSTITWKALPGSNTYQLFALGPNDKEPQLLASTEENKFSYQSQTGSGKLISISAQTNNGAFSRRSAPDKELPYKNADQVANAAQGLRYQYYEGSWESMPDLNKLMPVKTGVTDLIDIVKVRRRDLNYAVRFEGYLKIDKKDEYEFQFTGWDSAVFNLGDVMILKNAASGTIALKPGLHHFTIDFYSGNASGHLCDLNFGPAGGVKRNPMTSELFRDNTNFLPLVYLTAPDSGSVYNTGINIPITAMASDTDGTVKNIAFFSNSALIGVDSVAPFEINWSNTTPRLYKIFATATDNSGGQRSTQAIQIRLTDGPENIALHKNAFASSAESKTTPASFAVDGNLKTRWSSVFSDNQWIYIDLEKTYAINRVKIVWENAYGKDYLIQVSKNLNEWSDLKAVSGNSSLRNDYTNLSGTGRYLRVFGKKRGTGFGFSIFELEVNGTVITSDFSVTIGTLIKGQQFHASADILVSANVHDPGLQIAKIEFYINGIKIGEDLIPPFAFSFKGSVAGINAIVAKIISRKGIEALSEPVLINVVPDMTNIALNKPTFSSSERSPDLPASHANDGDYTTRWSSLFDDQEWLMIDLQQNYQIDGVTIIWETALGKNYSLLVSDDKNTWRVLKEVENNTSLSNTLKGLSGNGRFLKILGKTRGTGYGYSIFEIEVFGKPKVIAPKLSISALPKAGVIGKMASVFINASAGSSTEIEKIEFFNGALKLAEIREAPYEFTWNNVASGKYVIIAKVTDTRGLFSFSLPVEVNIAAAPANIALFKKVIASSEEKSTTSAFFAVDGDPATRWSSTFSDPQWIVVSLNNSYRINRMVLNWETASGKDFLIQFSDDSIHWTDVITEYGNSHSKNDYSNISGSAKYIKLKGTQRNTGFGYSIYEFEIYGNIMPPLRQSEVTLLKDNAENLLIFPNPAYNTIHINKVTAENTHVTGKLKITNMLDQEVYSTDISTDNIDMDLDISHIPDGNYSIIYLSESKKLVRRLTVIR